MLPWDVNHQAFAGHRKAVAHSLGVSVTLVDKYCTEPKPTGDGEHSPVERTIETVRALREVGAATSELLIEYLMKELGYLPPVRMEEVAEPASLLSAGALMKETGEAVAAHGDLISDGHLSVSDAISLEAQLTDVARVVERERCSLLKFIADAEDLEVRKRIGPKRMTRFIESRKALSA